MKLILVTGAPASGKSTIAEAISKHTRIRYISKDLFKIRLFERYGFTTHSEKKRLSILGESQMYDEIQQCVDTNENLIVDNNFKDFIKIREIIKEKNVDLYCIYCDCEYELLAQRYNERIRTGNRHPALYTLNYYPIKEGISMFHPIISKDDVFRIQKNVTEKHFGNNILIIETDNILHDFDSIVKKALCFLNK